MRESKRYLGLELSGAKNQKTALASIEYYPKEKKIFLLETFERIGETEKHSADEELILLLGEMAERKSEVIMGVNVPLELPPCITCIRKTCPLQTKCTVPAVKNMREIVRKAARDPETRDRVRDFTPFTQRPIEIFLRYQVMPGLPETHRFEIDETLGGNRAPLTARMHFLKRHLTNLQMIEVLPKLTVSLLGIEFQLNKRVIANYRHLEEGNHARELFLEALMEKHGVFIYERDIRKLSHNLTTFDAFICAYTALLSDLERCEKAPSGFAKASGWVEFPQR